MWIWFGMLASCRYRPTDNKLTMGGLVLPSTTCKLKLHLKYKGVVITLLLLVRWAAIHFCIYFKCWSCLDWLKYSFKWTHNVTLDSYPSVVHSEVNWPSAKRWIFEKELALHILRNMLKFPTKLHPSISGTLLKTGMRFFHLATHFPVGTGIGFCRPLSPPLFQNFPPPHLLAWRGFRDIYRGRSWGAAAAHRGTTITSHHLWHCRLQTCVLFQNRLLFFWPPSC